MEQKTPPNSPEKVSDLTTPAQIYWSTHITVPSKLHQGADRFIYSLVGAYNRRSSLLRNKHKTAEQIVTESKSLMQITDRKLRDCLTDLQSIFRRQKKGYEESMPKALAAIAAAADRTLGLSPYKVQIMGAMALYEGYLAEMATGEGKSLTACIPAILSGWSGNPCHIITVNDYLAARDAHAMKSFYSFCGVTAGCVTSEMEPGERRINYLKDVVYTTSKEILADFLRDRLKVGRCHQARRRMLQYLLNPRMGGRDELVMRGLDTAIIDEADSVLIDEAVTPLIISHPQENTPLLDACQAAQNISEKLALETDYTINLRYKEINLTNTGKEKIQALAASLPGLWRGITRSEELVSQALTAKEFYHKDQQYVIQDGKVVIVDEYTGRLMPNRTWRHGLHQAVEKKEGLELSSPSETLARLSFQRFFRFFRKLSGMTGTASEATSEFWYIYGLPILKIPTNKPCIRKVFPDSVSLNADQKWQAILEDIEKWHNIGRPILIGTRSVSASEKLASMLAEKGLSFNLLNATRHKEEARIVAAAGEKYMITIATNMAGRGTDIKLGRGVAELGGLHVIATERHDSGRIDRQLFGRCARQGDPGSSQAFICMDDEILKRFLPKSIQNLLGSSITKQFPGADKIVEQAPRISQKIAQKQAFRQRKSVLQMDTWLADALSFAGSASEY